MNDAPLKLVTTKSDKEKAEEYKRRAVEAAQPFMAVLTEAAKEDFKFNIQFGEDFTGKVVIAGLMLVKQF